MRVQSALPSGWKVSFAVIVSSLFSPSRAVRCCARARAIRLQCSFVSSPSHSRSVKLFNGLQKKLPDSAIDKLDPSGVRRAFAPEKKSLFPELLELHARIRNRQVLLRREFCRP